MTDSQDTAGREETVGRKGTESSRRVALVTGGGSGIGSGLCRHLGDRGYDVLIHFRSNREAAERVAADIRSTGRRAQPIQADLGGEAGAVAVRDAVAAEFGRLDLLINNAGAYHEKGFYELTEADWFEELNSTATAVYFTTRTLIPMLRESRGRVVNIGDTDCTQPGFRLRAPGYHVGKSGVWILTCTFATLEAPHGVAVNMISPGLIENSQGLGSPDVVPAGRFGTNADLAAALDMLLAVDAPYITGSNITVSGGWNL